MNSIDVLAAPMFFTQGGNSFGDIAVLGTNDNFGLSIKTNNLERIFLDENGNIGLGTSTPQESFHIAKEHVRIDNGGDLQFTDLGGGSQNIQFFSSSPFPLAQISYETAQGGLVLSTVGYDVFIQSGSGNVGIGTAFPQGDVQVVKPGSATFYLGSSEESVLGQTKGCLVLGDSDGFGVTYITANDGVLTSSTVKPSICD